MMKNMEPLSLCFARTYAPTPQAYASLVKTSKFQQKIYIMLFSYIHYL